MLAQLKNASTSAAVEEEEQNKVETHVEEKEEEKKEETVTKVVGKKQNKKSLAKKKASNTPPPPPAATATTLATKTITNPTFDPSSTASTDPSSSPTTDSATDSVTTPTSSIHALVPKLESRLQALQAKIASMEESREDLAASKAKSEEELREARIAIELVTAEKKKLASQVEDHKKKVAAAEKVAKEKDAALKAEKLRVAELADKVVESKTASSKEQEDMSTRWKAKVTTLTSEVEKLKTELENAIQATTEAQTAQNTAEQARIEAEQKESAAEQRAIAAINEATRLKASSTQAEDKSEQLIKDNERRSKTFNAAVEAQVQRFKASLEEERDAALARVEEAHKENINLQQRVVEVTAALQEAKEIAEEHAAAVVVEKGRVEEYETVVKSMQGQVAAAVKASESAEVELKIRQAQWEEERNALKNKLITLETELKTAVDRCQQAEMSVSTVRAEAEQWRASAQRVDEAQAAEIAARNEAESATAEAAALKIEIAHLKREIAKHNIANNDTGGSDFGTTTTTPSKNSSTAAAGMVSAPGTTSKSKNESSLPGSSRPFRRESSSNGLSGFDLESLRRTPLLSGATRATEQRRSSSAFIGSSKQAVWLYMALVHVLLLVAMGRASHAHLACEHLHLAAIEGGLP
jgi:hypothetical protein